MQHTSDLDGYMFDVSTVTAKDYTVEMDITDDMWQDFEDNQYRAAKDKGLQISKALYLKEYLIKKIGEILTNYSVQQKLHDSHHHDSEAINADENTLKE